jgi:hypothetical protein
LAQDAAQLRAAIDTGRAEEPNLTVPLQTPSALLQQDAAEAAPTMPVTGLTEEQLRQLDAFKGRAGAAVQKASPSGAVGTVEQPGLSDEILRRATGLQNLVQGMALPPLPASHVATVGAQDARTLERPSLDEEKIPTRAVEGLSDRAVNIYARELYMEEGVLVTSSIEAPDLREVERRTAEAVAKAQEERKQSWIIEAQRPPEAAPLGRSPVAQSTPSGSSPLRRISSNSGLPVAPSPQAGSPRPHHPTPSSSAPPNMGGSGPSMGGAGPSMGGGAGPSMGGSGPSAAPRGGPPSGENRTFAMGAPMGLPSEESFSMSGVTEAHSAGPIAAAGRKTERMADPTASQLGGPRTDERPRSNLSRGGGGVWVFLVVGALVLGLLAVGGFVGYRFFLQAPDGPSDKADKDADKDADKGGGKADKADKTPRHERFGFSPLDGDSPFKVSNTKVQIEPSSKGKVKITLEGTLTHGGASALDKGQVLGTVGVQFKDRVATYSLVGQGLDPEVSRQKPWKPGEQRRFVLYVEDVPDTVSAADLPDRFVWLALQASNGKVYAYDAAIAAIKF